MKIDKVSFFGYADTNNTDNLFKQVYDVAYHVAKAGYVVVDGGGPGVMKAASLGAKKAKGWVIGVTFYAKETENFEGRDLSNPINQEVVTPNYVERTLKLLEVGDIYVIFNGGTGTISEFAMAWGLARIYFGHHKPLILYGRFWEEVIFAFQKNMLIRPEELKVFDIVESPSQVISSIKKFDKYLKTGKHWHKSTAETAFQL
jgi:uncharacterized protein (TIGR00730 family)